MDDLETEFVDGPECLLSGCVEQLCQGTGNQGRQKRLVLFFGPPGIGTTRCSKECAKRLKIANRWRQQIFINLRGCRNKAELLEEVCVELGIEQPPDDVDIRRWRSLSDWIKGLHEETLIMFDDPEDMVEPHELQTLFQNICMKLIEGSPHTLVFIASSVKYSFAKYNPVCMDVRVRPLDLVRSMKLLHTVLQENGSEDDMFEPGLIENISKLTAGYPSAIIMAGVELTSHDGILSAEDLVELLEESRLENLSPEEYAGEEQIITGVRASLSRMKETMQGNVKTLATNLPDSFSKNAAKSALDKNVKDLVGLDRFGAVANDRHKNQITLEPYVKEYAIGYMDGDVSNPQEAIRKVLVYAAGIALTNPAEAESLLKQEHIMKQLASEARKTEGHAFHGELFDQQLADEERKARCGFICCIALDLLGEGSQADNLWHTLKDFLSCANSSSVNQAFVEVLVRFVCCEMNDLNLVKYCQFALDTMQDFEMFTNNWVACFRSYLGIGQPAQTDDFKTVDGLLQETLSLDYDSNYPSNCNTNGEVDDATARGECGGMFASDKVNLEEFAHFVNKRQEPEGSAFTSESPRTVVKSDTSVLRGLRDRHPGVDQQQREASTLDEEHFSVDRSASLSVESGRYDELESQVMFLRSEDHLETRIKTIDLSGHGEEDKHKRRGGTFWGRNQLTEDEISGMSQQSSTWKMPQVSSEVVYQRDRLGDEHHLNNTMGGTANTNIEEIQHGSSGEAHSDTLQDSPDNILTSWTWKSVTPDEISGSHGVVTAQSMNKNALKEPTHNTFS